MPLRGAKTQPGFHPFANHFRCESFPDSGRKSAAGGHALWWLCFPGGVPLRGAKTRWVFIPLRIIFDANPSPVLAENQRWADRTPPYGGCASPAGAQCRRKGVFCPPGTMPDWGRGYN
ncbi:MAG: hypothetical protein LBK61_04005 [Spirochaetaceae bacterium]|nr:hypothetical protein [Spirochaetaceae bacterium]